MSSPPGVTVLVGFNVPLLVGVTVGFGWLVGPPFPLWHPGINTTPSTATAAVHQITNCCEDEVCACVERLRTLGCQQVGSDPLAERLDCICMSGARLLATEDATANSDEHLYVSTLRASKTQYGSFVTNTADTAGCSRCGPTAIPFAPTVARGADAPKVPLAYACDEHLQRALAMSATSLQSAQCRW